MASSIKEKINSDIKAAMIAKDNFKRDTLRVVMSLLKQVEVDERKELTDEDVIKILQKAIKQREDAAAQYKAGHRDDLYQKEMNEIALIKEYLPAQLSDEELKNELVAIISEVGAKDSKDIGKVMGVATKKLAGKADNRRINEIARSLLS